MLMRPLKGRSCLQMGFPGIEEGLGTGSHFPGGWRGTIKAVSQQGGCWEASPNWEMLFSRFGSDPKGSSGLLQGGMIPNSEPPKSSAPLQSP